MNRFPRPGDEVMLAVPQRETVHALVAGMGDGYLDLEMMASPRTPMHQLERMKVFVEFINDEGISRLHGRLGSLGGGPLDFGRGGDDVVRFSHTHQVQLLQRREAIRAFAQLPCNLWRPAREDGPPISTQTLDISGNGLLLANVPLPREGEEYLFELILDPRDPRVLPIRGRIRVESVTEKADARVGFVTIEERDRALITHMAFDLQREQRGWAA